MDAVRRFLLMLMICALVDVAGAASTIQWTGRPDDQDAASNNTANLNAALATLKSGDKLVIPNRTFWLAGGVRAEGRRLLRQVRHPQLPPVRLSGRGGTLRRRDSPAGKVCVLRTEGGRRADGG